MINSSLPKGICYVETKGLDGETNLKIRTKPNDLPLSITGSSLRGTLFCEPPNSLLNFNGLLRLDDNSYNTENDVGVVPNEIGGAQKEVVGGVQKEVGVGFDNLILRGSKLRNTFL